MLHIRARGGPRTPGSVRWRKIPPWPSPWRSAGLERGVPDARESPASPPEDGSPRESSSVHGNRDTATRRRQTPGASVPASESAQEKISENQLRSGTSKVAERPAQNGPRRDVCAHGVRLRTTRERRNQPSRALRSLLQLDGPLVGFAGKQEERFPRTTFPAESSPETQAATTALAAGGMLAMLMDTMIPEAFENTHNYWGSSPRRTFSAPSLCRSSQVDPEPDRTSSSWWLVARWPCNSGGTAPCWIYGRRRFRMPPFGS